MPKSTMDVFVWYEKDVSVGVLGDQLEKSKEPILADRRTLGAQMGPPSHEDVYKGRPCCRYEDLKLTIFFSNGGNGIDHFILEPRS